jgi:hypothetical protein
VKIAVFSNVIRLTICSENSGRLRRYFVSVLDTVVSKGLNAFIFIFIISNCLAVAVDFNPQQNLRENLISYCLPWWCNKQVPLKRLYIHTKEHDVTSQKDNYFRSNRREN